MIESRKSLIMFLKILIKPVISALSVRKNYNPVPELHMQFMHVGNFSRYPEGGVGAKYGPNFC